MARISKHQKKALSVLLNRIEEEKQFTTLQGFAGTGKTFLIGKLINRLVRNRTKVHVCAPTHKAAQVLNGKITRKYIQAKTIHSFLGLKLQPDSRGEYELVHDPEKMVPEEGVVMVDEASMIGTQEWPHICAAEGLMWVFVGDPAQLPPVNEDASPVFEIEGPMLTEIVRQAKDNPIIRLATKVRNGDPFGLDGYFINGKGVGMTGNAAAFQDSALRAFKSEQFKKDSSYARVLAYRNKTVQAYNKRIRFAIFSDNVPRFVEDEWLVARDSWYFEDMPLLTNSEEIRVLKAKEDDYDTLETGVWKTWRLSVKGPNNLYNRELFVLHESEQPRYRESLKNLKLASIRDASKWKQYYKLRESFASVDYAYASTVHKAQGSTFHTTFVDYRDTMACRGKEKQALLYVAVTRPTDRLALLV